ncbi:MAG TPA: substrate-binding domain-containing protein [Xanthobacteraceae bacterium]|nr:substrate-binding domain-containing protein [Xanthobacteraceae bacterium]
MKSFVIATCVVAAWSASAAAAEIKVLSAGAVEPGLVRAVEAFKRTSGTEVKIQFNTAPQLAKKLADGESADVLVAPPALLDEQTKAGKVVADGRVALGRVGAGVLVRTNATAPDITTSEALKQALLSADSIVYNTASSGQYIAKMIEKLGIAGEVKAKTTLYPDANAVVEHVAKGKGNEIGFSPIPEIKQSEHKGVKLVGPLPADIQNYTSYGAAALSSAASKDAAKAFLAFLATPEAKQAFVSAGIE